MNTHRCCTEACYTLAALLLCLSPACLFDPGPLEARQCTATADCPEGQSCAEGFCRTDEAPGVCTVDADCDDDNFCNGPERCRPGWALADALGCMPGAPPDLDDGIACTRDLCDALSDEIVHIPTTDCECSTDGDCQAPEGQCQSVICTPQLTCAVMNSPADTPCDDAVGCTLNDVCDGEGTCAGIPSNGLCDDGLFCNGPEACDANGCLAGLPPSPDEEVPACASISCDEGTDRFVVDEAGCLCLLDSDCETPCTGAATCEAGQCVRIFLPPETICTDGDGTACTTGLCDDQGACVPTPDHASCEGACREGALCQPTDLGADLAGCVFTPTSEGEPCETVCGGVTEGICEVGVCLIPDLPALYPESLVGGPLCVDGIDNDCDGALDEADPGCAQPDTLTISAPETGVAGLYTGGVEIDLLPMRGQTPLSDQALYLTCSGRAVGPSRVFDAPEVIERLSGDPDLHVYGPSGFEIVDAGDQIVSGVPWLDDEPDGVRGARICGGHGLSFGPFDMPPAIGTIRTYQLSVRAGSQVEGGLGPRAWLLISYRTGNTLNEDRFVPLVAIDAQDTTLEDYTFAIRNGGGVNTLEVRADVIGATPEDAQGACGFLEKVAFYEVRSPQTGVRRPNWLVQGRARAAVEIFLGAEAPDLLLAPQPDLTHDMSLIAEANTTNGLGVSWRATEGGGSPASAFVELPRPIPTVLPARGSPLYFDYNGALADGSLADGELLHLLVSAAPGERFRKLASALPTESAPDHLISPYQFSDRMMVLLPESSHTLDALRLRFAHTPLSESARVWLDSLYLYFHHDQAAVEVRADLAIGAPGQGRHTLRLFSTRAVPVEVRCHWQRSGSTAVSSEPVIVAFE